LHRKTDYFPRLLTILVYPSTYLVDENRPVEGPVWEEGKMSRLGETGRTMGSMVMAWDAVKWGAADPSDGKNVVLHEFAHQLDYENAASDGAPVLATREQQKS
jgi:Mlc titration factor MtfA (ptsG expression regulator)